MHLTQSSQLRAIRGHGELDNIVHYRCELRTFRLTVGPAVVAIRSGRRHSIDRLRNEIANETGNVQADECLADDFHNYTAAWRTRSR